MPAPEYPFTPQDLKQISTAHLASLLKIGESTVQAAVRRGMPCIKLGRFVAYDAAEAIEWYWRDKLGGGQDDPKTAAEARYRQAKAEHAEFQLMEKAGDLVLRSEVSALLMKMAAIAGPAVESLASRLSSDLAAESDPGACKRILTVELRRVRGEVADALEDLASELGSGPVGAVASPTSPDA